MAAMLRLTLCALVISQGLGDGAAESLGSNTSLAGDRGKVSQVLHSADANRSSVLAETGSDSDSEGRCSSAEVPLNSKCTGCPPRLDGKLCASTTWYEDRTKGSCGCGPREIVDEDYWTLTGWTAALNAVNLDPANPASSWCPSGCGQCFELCSTGGATNTLDKAAPAGQCKVFKITNRCGDGWNQDRPDWCSQKLSYQACHDNPVECRKHRSTNMFGYSAHFDLQDAHRQIQHGLGWDNAEVTFEAVSCDRWEGPKDATCDGCNRHSR